MKRTISALFDSWVEARTAVSQLRAAGIAEGDISLVANNAAVDGTGATETDAGSDAAAGAGLGAVVGGLGGLLTGIGLLAIPGFGPVVAAGWFTATAVGAGAGAVVGGAAGGLVRAMTERGIDRRDAEIYAEGVRRGGSLVAVSTEERDLEAARAILQRGSVDLRSREQTYRDSGWNGFDDRASSYTADEIRAERGRHLGTPGTPQKWLAVPPLEAGYGGDRLVCLEQPAQV